MKVGDILDLINCWAPFDTAEEFDNVGFLVGDITDDVRGILIALDVTGAVIGEAGSLGANLIVTHHPVIFDPMSDMTFGSVQGRHCQQLARNGISVISAHTNLDIADGGVSCAMAERLGLTNVRRSDALPYFRLGELPEEMGAGAFAMLVKEAFGSAVVLSAGTAPDKIKTVCVAGGAGGGDTGAAKLTGADVYLTGSAKHKNAIEAEANGVYMVTAGHYETEAPILPNIRAYLQKHAN